jgi:uncharacterized protein YndB with AHSA1/START domain
LLRAVVVTLAIASAPNAVADIRHSAPDSFLLEWSYRVEASPGPVYEALGRIGEWWSGAHTYSGNAANLTLRPDAGACLCERWRDGSVEHGRVVLALKDRMLRIDAAFGPLQAKAVTGVLAFAFKAEEGATALGITYRVSGAAASALDRDAASVDQVLGEQFARLVRYVETGKAAP